MMTPVLRSLRLRGLALVSAGVVGLLAACGSSGSATKSTDAAFRFDPVDDVCGVRPCPASPVADEGQLESCRALMSVPDDPCRDTYKRIVGCGLAAAVCKADGTVDEEKSSEGVAEHCTSVAAEMEACCTEHAGSAICSE